MQSHATGAGANPRRRDRHTLWLILALCAAPVIASYVAFYWWRPASHVNYGTLIDPRPMTDTTLVTPDRGAVRLSTLRGQWVLLTVDAPTCGRRCREKLVYMRQVRLAQGKDAERIERVWLLTGAGAVDPALTAEHPGLIVARDADGALIRALPAERTPADHIYIIDPLGNLMMRFPDQPDPRRMLKDVARLLRHSNWK